MTVDGEGNNKTSEVNHRVGDEDKRVGDGVMNEVLGALKDNGFRSDRVDGNIESEHAQAVQTQVVLQVPQQPSQGSSVVCWERFLHVGSIKVLLVENDDSTRHVVTALLRNCNYEVMEAANGLQAWKILEDLTNHIDLVLTEVVMPCLSGIGLLCKIMSHKTRNNIPVIMMSSHDSMGLVFKCLSKGAVDFLVKPIRKNELKNLWQHVWRRCHSSSSSGSESGTQTQTQKSVKSSSSQKSDNSGSNDGEDNGSTGLNISDGSVDGSGTQSSWTKQAVEIDSLRSLSPWDQIVECPDSTCAQVIRSNAETSGNKWLSMAVTRECSEQEDQLENVAKSKELVTCKCRNLEPKNPIEVPVGATDQRESMINCKRKEKGTTDCGGERLSNKHKAMNLFGFQMNSGDFERPRELAKVSDTNGTVDDLKESTVIEHSLKRLRGVEDTGKTVQDDRNVLRRSELSAFSRYNTTSNAFKPPNWMTGSSSLLDNSLEIKKESLCDVQSHSNGNLPYPSTNGVSNNIDMGSTTNKHSANPLVLKDKSEATSTINGLHPSSAFKLTRNDPGCTPQQVMLAKADDMAATAGVAPQRNSHQELQIEHIHHHHHHHHHHFHSMEQQRLLSNHNDLSLKKMAADAPHCGSSNVLGRLVDGNPGNYRLNKSASGSNHGSNGQNGSSTAVNAGGTNVETDIGAAGKSGSGDASRSGIRMDQNKSARREAALNKFHQKRKE